MEACQCRVRASILHQEKALLKKKKKKKLGGMAIFIISLEVPTSKVLKL